MNFTRISIPVSAIVLGILTLNACTEAPLSKTPPPSVNIGSPSPTDRATNDNSRENEAGAASGAKSSSNNNHEAAAVPGSSNSAGSSSVAKSPGASTTPRPSVSSETTYPIEDGKLTVKSNGAWNIISSKNYNSYTFVDEDGSWSQAIDSENHISVKVDGSWTLKKGGKYTFINPDGSYYSTEAGSGVAPPERPQVPQKPENSNAATPKEPVTPTYEKKR